VGIRDGSGLIRGNVFRNLRTVTNFRSLVGISISYGKHNNIPVEGCMPRDIRFEDNACVMHEGVKYEACRMGKAENIIVDGEIVLKTRVERSPPPLPSLIPMNTPGKTTGKAVHVPRPAERDAGLPSDLPVGPHWRDAGRCLDADGRVSRGN